MAPVFENERQRAIFLDLLASTIRLCRLIIEYKRQSRGRYNYNVEEHENARAIINKCLQSGYTLDLDNAQQSTKELNELEQIFNELTGLKQQLN